MAEPLRVREYDNRLFRDSFHFSWDEAVFRKEQRDELREAILKHWHDDARH